MLKASFLASLASAVPTAKHHTQRNNTVLNVKLLIATGLLNAPIDSRIVLMAAPNETDPLDDTDVTSSPNKIFGKNVYNFGPKQPFTLSVGNNDSTATSVYGWPNVSLSDIDPGTYITRSDGLKVSVRFSCGDSAPNVDGYGSLITSLQDVRISGSGQTLELTFNNITTAENFAGKEIGGCNQGNYEDTDTLKHIKIRSKKLSKFWGHDMYVGACNYGLGPYGDRINEELIPHLEDTFNTIRAPYARIQDVDSTGGWESIANVIYRPGLLGIYFFLYPDSLDFHRHQDIELYSAANAYTRADGSSVSSIRTRTNGTKWDVWNAVFGVQGYNNYPLEPWDKVTNEIYPEAVEHWKPFDLNDCVVTNFNSSRNLDAALAGRIFIYVGTWNNYFLNEGVMEFQKRTDAVGGAGWVNVTILPEKPHGGNYQAREIGITSSWWTVGSKITLPTVPRHFLLLPPYHLPVEMYERMLLKEKKAKVGQEVTANVGRWDPGVKLTAQWILNSKPACEAFSVGQGAGVKYVPTEKGHIQLLVTGEKRNYATETRKSKRVLIGG
ncbi:hypothetical protein G6011_01317 [Alternaria panax]|uniref:Uncharacterized protein n=1 Tax=Alternaria panax TaxID=48097 RepID=A0AAD4IJN4_9PLEO|nr:hypothetical protein G6011_01317 [Alternaria panax]